MHNLDILEELGPDVDLITRSEAWLHAHGEHLRLQLALISEQLAPIQIAIRIKRNLQQKNLVVVRKSEAGNTTFSIQPIATAIKSLTNEIIKSDLPVGLRSTNMFSQLAAWESDGFDIQTACTGK